MSTTLWQDPRWQRKRLEIFERDGFACTECGAKDKQLSVHHFYYCKGRAPWEYPLWALATRCSDCHDRDSQTVRNDDGGFELAEWEQAIEWLSDGNPANFTARNGLWDLGVWKEQQKR